ncbi:type II secretion system GspH family protein [Idiomarina seosinensis]|uniref:PulJ/GspJ family protein n=1 Tax=Idiomarina seosinensis TaxID=281739 RepID=UPI0038505CAB
MQHKPTDNGFTLIELILVIVLLAIVGTFSFQFIGFGAQVYSDTSAREQLVSQSRFALERLSRELRNALPRSVRTLNNGQCIEYLPIETTSEYLDLPTPGNSDQPLLGVRPLERATPYSGTFAIALYASRDVYSNSAQIYTIASETLVDNDQAIEFEFVDNDATFSQTGPVDRYFKIASPITWCYVPATGRLRRYQGYNRGGSYTDGSAVSQIMAESLNNSAEGIRLFTVNDATLTRNNLVLIDFAFARTDSAEPLKLLYEVHIPNVP